MYLSTSELLRDKFKEKKESNPSFSIRAWSQQMGFKSHGSLQQIISSGRAIPKKFVPLLVESLKMTQAEAQYFEVLIDYEKAKTQKEKEFYHSKLIKIRPQKNEVKFVELENFKYFQEPLHAIIRCLMDRKDFKADPKWIKRQLRFPVGLREIEETIERLITLGLVTEGKNGQLTKVYPSVINKIDVPSAAVQEYHAKMSVLASQEVKKQDVAEREFNSFCFNIKKASLPSAKLRLRELIKEFMSEFEADPKISIETYNLNVQLFSLTTKETK